MFSATYFTYDGVFSGQYGLMMADFEDNFVVETTAFSSVLNAVKPAQLHRFIHGGITYENPPQYQFSIISEAPIPAVLRREILSWLVGRDAFKKLQIHQVDLENYYYNCVFTQTDIIYINGRCHGFRLNATFDSPYAYKPCNVVNVPPGTSEICITVDSMQDAYVYPIVEFEAGDCVIDDNTPIDIVNWINKANPDGISLSSLNLAITNLTDDENRCSVFANIHTYASVRNYAKSYELGNVDLLNRPNVDLGDGSYATVLSTWDFFRSGDGYTTVHYTPILQDGTIMSDDEARNYISTLCSNGGNVLSNDTHGIILKCTNSPDNLYDEIVKLQSGEEYSDELWNYMSEEGKWGENLHKSQELYYGYIKTYGTSNAKIIMDNGARYIKTDREDCYAVRYFNKNWIRLRPGRNDLRVISQYGAKITIPVLDMIGF